MDHGTHGRRHEGYVETYRKAKPALRQPTAPGIAAVAPLSPTCAPFSGGLALWAKAESGVRLGAAVARPFGRVAFLARLGPGRRNVGRCGATTGQLSRGSKNAHGGRSRAGAGECGAGLVAVLLEDLGGTPGRQWPCAGDRFILRGPETAHAGDGYVLPARRAESFDVASHPTGARANRQPLRFRFAGLAGLLRHRVLLAAPFIARFRCVCKRNLLLIRRLANDARNTRRAMTSNRVDLMRGQVLAVGSPSPYDVSLRAQWLRPAFQILEARQPVSAGNLAGFPNGGNGVDWLIGTVGGLNDQHGDAQVRGFGERDRESARLVAGLCCSRHTPQFITQGLPKGKRIIGKQRKKARRSRAGRAWKEGDGGCYW